MNNEWLYKGKKIKSIDDIKNNTKYIGFVYIIKNTNPKSLFYNKVYIGKKNFYHNRRAKITIKEKTNTQTRKKFKVITKESDWLTYYGSCKELTSDINKTSKDDFKREILILCSNKKELSYCELEYQVKFDVLRDDNCYNSNILGRFFKKDVK